MTTMIQESKYRTKPARDEWQVVIHQPDAESYSRFFDNERDAKRFAQGMAASMDLAALNHFPTGMVASVTLRRSTSVTYY